MARIMCTPTLWRRLGYSARPLTEASEPCLPDAYLGSWAAKVFRCDRRDLVIAVNERTYLTIVFPLAPRAKFNAHFVQALGNVLADLGIAESIVRAESAAVEFAPVTLLKRPDLVCALDNVEFICAIELSYHDDLRTVQRNLNDLPHPDRNPCVPVEAVRRLLGSAAPTRSQAVH